MKVLIVDDEPLARQRLRQLLELDDAHSVVGEAGTGAEALALAAKKKPDVVLLDIRMPGMSGIETARHLNELEQAPAIVFTTAYDEYAIAAFDAQAVGYVLKPVRRSRLDTALEQAAKVAAGTLRSMAEDAGLGAPRRHVGVTNHGELRLIPVADILGFFADQKYVRIEHSDGEDLVAEPLKAFEAEFGDNFVRVHRGALIAIRNIERVAKTADGKHCVVLRQPSHVGGKQMIISRRHIADVRRRLKDA